MLSSLSMVRILRCDIWVYITGKGRTQQQDQRNEHQQVGEVDVKHHAQQGPRWREHGEDDGGQPRMSIEENYKVITEFINTRYLGQYTYECGHSVPTKSDGLHHHGQVVVD